jgi:hypothetical protein
LKLGALERICTRWLWVGVVIFATGCGNEDKQRLASIGHKLAVRAEAFAGKDSKLVRGWQAMRCEWAEPALDARVGLRLRWDNSLASAQIRVAASAGAIELTGAVRDLAQRRRAVELAESTAGVEKVTDALEMAPDGNQNGKAQGGSE